MTTLILTREEKLLYEALPKSLREGWSVREPDVVCHEQLEDLLMRLKVFAPKEFPYTSFLKDGKKINNAKELESVAASFPVEKLSYTQMIDVFFLLGTKIIGGMIVYALKHAKTDEDIEGVMTMSIIRDAQFKANNSVCRCA